MGLTSGQEACVNTLDRPLAVAAGAGSGKTFTLTQRIVHALESGFVEDIDEVCAITFTNKAAGELKSRIKGALRACGKIDQAQKVDEAWISTIHGMCSRILHAHAIELGIDPSFTIASTREAEELLACAMNDVLGEAQEGDSPRLDALFDAFPAYSAGYGVSVAGMLGKLVEAASTLPDGVDAIELPGLTVSPQLAVGQYLEIMETLVDLASQGKQSESCEAWLADTTSQLDVARSAFEKGVASAEEAHDMLSAFRTNAQFGSKEYRAAVKEARPTLAALAMEMQLAIARPHLETLVDLAACVLDRFARAKRESGLLDNNDLLVMAARAIEEHPAIAARYVDKFKLVMVDEFQDTDQMQVDMIRRIAGAQGERLCVVGDAQQSIYRFRGADVAVYRRHLEAVRKREDGSVIELADNFRSHADVLAFVDCVFGRADAFGGEFMSLSAGRDECSVSHPFVSDKPRITVQHTSWPTKGGSADAVTPVAARRIAAAFAELHDAGHSAGDMVLLLGSMKRAGVYAQAIRDCGLACVISGGSVFSDTVEALTVLAFARVLANPSDTESLYIVLTSPFFNLTSGDLLRLDRPLDRRLFSAVSREDQPVFSASGQQGGADGISPQLACAMSVMGNARASVGSCAVSEIIERAMLESGLLSRLEQLGAEGLASAGNYYKALRMIQGIESSGSIGAASTARLLEAELNSSKEAPGALSTSEGDYVRIMTVHSSKGLEFPIVAVAEFKEPRGSGSQFIVGTVDGRVYPSLSIGSLAADSDGRSALKSLVLGDDLDEGDLPALVESDSGALHRLLALESYANVGDWEEAKRLLYVAITRAKEAVIVSTRGQRTKSNPFGVPASVFRLVISALDPSGEGLGEGASSISFEGSQPARFEHLYYDRLVAEREGGEPCVWLDGSGELSAEADSSLVDSSASFSSGPHVGSPVCPQAGFPTESYAVPNPMKRLSAMSLPYSPLREGVFSYSSISESSHEGDILNRLADAFAVSCDDAAEAASAPPGDGGADGVSLILCGGAEADGFPTLHSNVSDEAPTSSSPLSEDPWLPDFAALRDEDRATDLGTAFHRLAQYAVIERTIGEPLRMPPDERIGALARTCNLDGMQQTRLREALGRWFGSSVARDMAAHARLSAEVPFFVSLDALGEPIYLEGEIDLLALEGNRALVVDYKTGGRADETADELRCKHVLQAACYAYAIMLQGFREVEAVFVRVERPRADDASEPQCVRYCFTADDQSRISDAIVQVYQKSMSARRAKLG